MIPLAYFDPQRLCYRVRFRAAKFDTRRAVPKNLYLYENIPYDKQSKRGLAIAQEWAMKEARRMEAFVRAGAPRQGEMSLEDLYALYRARNPNQVGDATIDRNDEMAANLTAYFKVPPSQIDLDRATEYRNERKARNRTIKNELSFLKHLLTWGYQARRVTGVSQLNLLTLPVIRKEPSRGIALSAEEVKEVLSYRLDHGTETFRRLIVFGITTMHRLTPLMAYRHEWADKQRSWQDVPGEWMKGGRPLSTPLSLASVSSLGAGARGLAFENFNGRPSKWPLASVKSLCADTGVRYFSAHDLRRTGMTILHDAGVSKLAIKALAGHAGGDVTDDYVRVGPDTLRDAVGVFDAFLAGIPLGNALASD